jgi:hypothetical protein
VAGRHAEHRSAFVVRHGHGGVGRVDDGMTWGRVGEARGGHSRRIIATATATRMTYKRGWPWSHSRCHVWVVGMFGEAGSGARGAQVEWGRYVVGPSVKAGGGTCTTGREGEEKREQAGQGQEAGQA